MTEGESSDEIRIGPAHTDEDLAWLAELWRREWAGEIMVTRGRVHRLGDLQAMIAYRSNDRVGAATYAVEANQCELTSIDALVPEQGIGTLLLQAVERVARGGGCWRVWLITTNDNVDALRFYQRRGYHLVAVHRGAIAESRRLKPSIPLIGRDGIPIRDEIEMEKLLGGDDR